MSTSFASCWSEVCTPTRLTPGADPRVAQATATPTEQNQEAFAMVRDAALRADTRMANQHSGVAPTADVPTSDDKKEENEGGVAASLPPPEVARMIPCKFFPNCRYGDRCLFHHPSGPIANHPDGVPPHGMQPMFFPGPNGMPFQPGPPPYGVPPPFMEMNHPMFPVPYGPNGVPFYPPPVSAQQDQKKSDDTTSGDKNDTKQGETSESTNTENSNHASNNRNARTTTNNKKVNNKPTRSDGNTQRGRVNQGSRPSCAFFARSACRYANDCRFPHVLPDGTDARQLPTDQESKSSKSSPRRSNTHGAQSHNVSDGEGASSGTSTPQGSGKKSTNARRNVNGNNPRGKGVRRNAAPVHTNRKTVQRVPNSDEFPALPGGTSTEAAPAPAENKATKANFSAILSAPAPSKPVKTPVETPTKSAEEKPSQEESNPADASPSTPAAAASSTSPSQTRDFAAVASAQQSTIAV
ncbi:metal ion binding protein [Malassezia pachydermatis]